MGFDNTFVVARWDRPLTDLAVNERLCPPEFRDPDEQLSWSRADGWQCYAPEGAYYDGKLVPPVSEIEAEIGGPVLGIGVARSDHYRLSFVEAGALRSIAYGPYDGRGSEVARQEMVERWGEQWLDEAVASLRRWAAPFADVSELALLAALSVRQVFAERTVFDLLKLFTLVPDEPRDDPDDDDVLRDVWWSREIPDAAYAVDAVEISHLRLQRPLEAYRRRDMVLAFTGAGTGVWSVEQAQWVAPPSPDRRRALDALEQAVRQQGWTDRQP